MAETAIESSRNRFRRALLNVIRENLHSTRAVELQVFSRRSIKTTYAQAERKKNEINKEMRNI